MCKLWLVLLTLLNISLGKEIKVYWDDNPLEEEVSFYYVLYGNSPGIYNGEGYHYDSYVTTPDTSIVLNVDDDNVTYILVIAYNNYFSPPSVEIKHTPGRKTEYTHSIETNPSTNNQALKFVISHDIGKQVRIEESTDLTNWVLSDTIVVGDGDTFIKYFDIDSERKFFRFSK